MNGLLEHVPSTLGLALTKLGPSLLVVGLAFLCHRVVQGALTGLGHKETISPSVASLLRVVTKWTFVVLTALLVLHQFGVLANVWAAAGAILAMIAIGFVAVWSIASNLSATVLLVVTKAFGVGDEVVILPEDIGGRVIDFNAFFTTLRSHDGSLIQLPNNLFFQKIIRRRPAKGPEVELREQLERSEPTE